MAKVVTMGEIMLRLSTPGNEKFIQADEFDVLYRPTTWNSALAAARRMWRFPWQITDMRWSL